MTHVYNQLTKLMHEVAPSDREIIARAMVRAGYMPPTAYTYNDAEVRAAMSQPVANYSARAVPRAHRDIEAESMTALSMVDFIRERSKRDNGGR